jgi:predicted RNase H-like HicB family nuclease
MVFSIDIKQTRQKLYQVTCPSLPGCSVFGPTAEEAKQNMTQAIVWYLAGLNVAPPERLELQVSEKNVEHL